MGAHRFNITAEFFQFVLMDETSKDDFSEMWTEEAFARLLAVAGDAICPGTIRNVEVPVEVIIVHGRPEIDTTECDHIAQASLSLPSGRLVVMGCTDYLPEAARVEVSPGIYEALYVIRGVKTITTEWDPADDLYTVYLWKGEWRASTLIKHWNAAANRLRHQLGQ